MSGVRRPGLDSRDGAAWTALLVLGAIMLIQLATVPFIPGGLPVLGRLAVTDGVVFGVALLLARAVRWERLAWGALLVFPLAMGGAFEISARLAPQVSPAYSPMLTILFVVVGLTQRRGVSVLLVVPAAACWLDMQAQEVTGQLAVRLVVTACVWVVVTELLAWKMGAHRRTHDQLTRVADRDPLTGLGNRRALDLARPDGDTVLVMIDLDHFKALNDAYGHLEGDRVLADFARVLVGVLRAGDNAYRYGGEEFLVIARNSGADGAERLLERVRRAWATVRPDLSFSAGIATWGREEPGPVALDRADGALYEAKTAGRDCWRVAGTPDVLVLEPTTPWSAPESRTRRQVSRASSD